MDNINSYIDPTAQVDEGAQIGAGSKIWHFSHLMPSSIIGENCVIGQNCFIANKVILGNRVKVQNNVSLYEGLVCEDDVFIGPSAVFTNVINPRAAIERKNEFKPTTIRKGASIGANATIICGNEIGQYALIGAGAVVTKSIPDFALVIGNPAIQVGWVSRSGIKLAFEHGQATCSESLEKYILEDNRVRLIDGK